MNHEFLQRQGSGSEESSSLSEPDLFRNVKSLPESTSSAGTLDRQIALALFLCKIKSYITIGYKTQNNAYKLLYFTRYH